MKIDRLLGILITLLQKEKVTAPYLAEKFEVSRRTINRDIEDLCLAGIPVVTMQGGKGGIAIADGYKLDKSVLTYEEMEALVTALKGLDSVSDKNHTRQILSKFPINQESIYSPKDSIVIDLSSHFKSGLTHKIALIKEAIHTNRLISFNYCSNKGESARRIEPYLIAFKWASWYILGYCRLRKDFRLFKLNRILNLTLTRESFIPRTIPEEKGDLNRYFKSEMEVTIQFEEEVKYRLMDEYGFDSFTKAENGKLRLTSGFTNKEYLISWILGFGNKAEVIEPEELREELAQMAKSILNTYQK